MKRLLTILSVCVMLLTSVVVFTPTADAHGDEAHSVASVDQVAATQEAALNALNLVQFQYTHVYYETHRYYGCAWNGSFYQWTWVQHRHTFIYSNNQTTEITGWGYMYYNQVPLTCYP
jgi:hypothetical protein